MPPRDTDRPPLGADMHASLPFIRTTAGAIREAGRAYNDPSVPQNHIDRWFAIVSMWFRDFLP